tara:strand:- start:97 stop:426 length:330 start_codon:yes stop_codon:yes gene_type:complete
MFEPLVLTEGALIRILRRYAKHLGISDVMGEVTAQVFLQIDSGAGNWNEWLLSNCGRCVESPESCRYFHPTEKQCRGKLTPEKLQQANMVVIDLGRIDTCPLRVDQTSS